MFFLLILLWTDYFLKKKKGKRKYWTLLYLHTNLLNIRKEFIFVTYYEASVASEYYALYAYEYYEL